MKILTNGLIFIPVKLNEDQISIIDQLHWIIKQSLSEPVLPQESHKQSK